jgi:hypothetical protein
MAMLAYAKGAAVAFQDDCDDALPLRRRKSPNGLGDVKKYREIQNDHLTKRDLNEKQWLCFLGMEFGWVQDERGILRAHPGKRETKDRDLSFEEVAAHYGLSRGTVEEYDRTARRVYRQHVEAVLFEGEDEE